MVSPLRVLLVDDNPDDRALVLHHLRKKFADIEAEQIVDPSGLDEALERCTFDLVITEFQLRWTDGIKVLKAIKSRCPHCPVIMFTGVGDEEIAVEAMKNGLDDYIIKKPSHFVRVQAAVNSAMEKLRSTHQMVELETRFKSLLVLINVGAFRCTPQGKLLESNAALTNLLALSKQSETVATNDLETFLKSTPCRQLFDHILQTGKCESREVEWKRLPRTPIWLSVNVAPATTASGEAVIDGLLEDITAQKRAAQEANRRRMAGSRLSLLSPREREVLQRVVVGKTNKVVAQELGISPKTVEMHRGKLMKKLCVSSVAELVRLTLCAAPLDDPID